MIDVHMIPTPGWDIQFAEQVERLAHPRINVIEGVFVAGNILEARYQSFLLGSSPYVTWVDDDDVVLDLSWIDRAVELLDTDPTVAAVYPRWKCTQGTKLLRETTGEPFNPTEYWKARGWVDMHHLTVMRRANVLSTLEYVRGIHPTMTRSTERLLTIGQLRFGRLVAVPELAYLWKLRNSSARTMREDEVIQQWAREHIDESITYLTAEQSRT